MSKELIYRRFGKIEEFIKRCPKDSRKWENMAGSIRSPEGTIVLDREDDKRVEALNCSVNDIVVVYGFGTGKTIESILDRYKKAVVVAIETIPEVIRAAIEEGGDLFLNSRFFIAAGDIGEIKNQIDAYLSIFGSRMIWGDLRQLILEGYSEPHFPLADLKAHLMRTTAPILVNTNTLLLSSERISENYIKSAPKMAVSQSVLKLKNRYKGKPAIAVASGPSLNETIEDIKAAQGRAIIIAADSAISILKASGIVPDYVCSVDYTQPNLIKFRSILKEGKINRELSLITIPDVYHSISYLFEDCYYVPKKSFFYSLDKDMIDSMNIPMNAVSHLSLGFAALLGADPIIMTGYDWSYPGGVDHAAGAEMENVVNYSDIDRKSVV